MKRRATLKKIFKQAWNEKTCFPLDRKDWDRSIPEIGQCAVTSLILQEVYGGKIAYNKNLNHFWITVWQDYRFNHRAI